MDLLNYGYYFDKNLTVNDVKILSIGTGIYRKPYSNKKSRKWGIFEWVKPSIDMMVSSTRSIVDYQLSKLFESFGCSNQYLRINPIIEENISLMDNIEEDNLLGLIKKGDETFELNKEQLRAFLEL